MERIYPFLLAILLALTGCRGDGPQALSDLPQPAGYSLVGQPFPNLAGKTLAGDSVLFPQVVRGQVAVLSVAFVNEAQKKIDAWMVPLKTEVLAYPNVVYYEIPVMRTYNTVVQEIAARGMRSGIPEEDHANVVCYHGDQQGYFQAFETRNTGEAYVFLLDTLGTVRFMAEGFPTDSARTAFRTTLQQLAGGGSRD